MHSAVLKTEGTVLHSLEIQCLTTMTLSPPSISLNFGLARRKYVSAEDLLHSANVRGGIFHRQRV